MKNLKFLLIFLFLFDIYMKYTEIKIINNFKQNHVRKYLK